MVRLICGIGINDVDEPVVVNGKRCTIHTRWSEMIKRCYSEKLQKTRYKTYIDCYVTNEWLTFSTFKEWMLTQDYEGKSLDKDILYEGNREYNPNKCVFVDSETNTFLLKPCTRTENLPFGVSFDKRDAVYSARVSINGKMKHIGRYQTASEASDGSMLVI